MERPANATRVGNTIKHLRGAQGVEDDLIVIRIAIGVVTTREPHRIVVIRRNVARIVRCNVALFILHTHRRVAVLSEKLRIKTQRGILAPRVVESGLLLVQRFVIHGSHADREQAGGNALVQIDHIAQ